MDARYDNISEEGVVGGTNLSRAFLGVLPLAIVLITVLAILAGK